MPVEYCYDTVARGSTTVAAVGAAAGFVGDLKIVVVVIVGPDVVQDGCVVAAAAANGEDDDVADGSVAAF